MILRTKKTEDVFNEILMLHSNTSLKFFYPIQFTDMTLCFFLVMTLCELRLSNSLASLFLPVLFGIMDITNNENTQQSFFTD